MAVADLLSRASTLYNGVSKSCKVSAKNRFIWRASFQEMLLVYPSASVFNGRKIR